MPPEPPAGAPPPPPAETTPVAAPPAAQWPSAAPMASRAVVPPRPGAITAASIILIIFGVILGLLGLLVMLGGALFPAIKDSPELADQLGSVPASFGMFILVLGAIMTAWGSLQVVAAIFVLARRTWARITAMILAILGALIGLATIIPGENGLTPVGATISLLFVGGHAFAIWALTSQGRWFSAVGDSPA
ncbi:MAG TPA: hypothetical protein VJY85_04270 [Candidatus Limnocylindria bacterium]|nr:hypothetical protein [Candidatus Limnocylindria bacterium]